MNVLFLSSWFPSSDAPFNGNFVIKHAEAVAEFHSVVFVNITKHPLSDKSRLEISDKVKVLELIYQPNKIPVINRILDKIQYLSLFFDALKILKRGNQFPDIVHVNVLYPAGVLAIIMRFLYQTPYLISEHWTGYSRFRKLSLVHRLVGRLICRKSDFICPVSDDLKKAMQQQFSGNYIVVPNVVDSSLFMNVMHKNHLTKQFVHVSSLHDEQKNWKGLLNVIKGLSNYNHFNLHIISDHETEKVTQYVSDLGIPDRMVMVHGPFSPAQIAQFLKRMDLFILFSRYENLPCVIAEAHVAGIPVFSTDVGGIKEMINSENGCLVKSEDEQGLFVLIESYLKGEIRFDTSAIQQKAIERYSYKSVGGIFSNLYQSMLVSKTNITNEGK